MGRRLVTVNLLWFANLEDRASVSWFGARYAELRGGEMIPVMRPRLPRFEDVRGLLEAMDERQVYSNDGPLVRELEALHAARLNVPVGRVVAAANATLALQALVATSTQKQWIVPDYTFAATGHAVLAAGRHLLLASVSGETGEIDETCLHPDSTNGGVLPVAPFGKAVDVRPWESFSEVIIDAAASLGQGAELSGQPSHVSIVFSLHATKVLPAGEGGLAVCSTDDRASEVRRYLNFGFDSNRISVVSATNGKMSEVAAAYGIASMKLWDVERSEWQTAQRLAMDASDRVGAQVFSATGLHPYWVIRLPDARSRIELQRLMSAAEVGHRLWWPVPLTEMPAFDGIRKLGDSRGAVELSGTLIGLPMYRGLEAASVEIVANLLARVLNAGS